MHVVGQTPSTVDAVPVPSWYRDFASCLQATFASLLQHAGHDPLTVLGSAWGFAHQPGAVTTEEFYYPAPDGDLGRALAPHCGLRSVWHRADADQGTRPLRACLEGGRLPIAAVDNFHLPFRPAHRDVHAAHLVVVTGVGDDQVHVLDSMPPAYRGPVALEDFQASWHSANPADHQDAFFSDSPIDGRWLEVDTAGVDSTMPPEGLHELLRRDNAVWRAPAAPGGPLTGLGGLGQWLDEVCAAARADDRAVLATVYVVGWGMQAQSCLHGEFLREQGSRHGSSELVSAGRQVERVGHQWTGLRVAAAHARRGDPTARGQIPRHAARLRHACEEAVEAIERAIGPRVGAPAQETV